MAPRRVSLGAKLGAEVLGSCYVRDESPAPWARRGRDLLGRRENRYMGSVSLGYGPNASGFNAKRLRAGFVSVALCDRFLAAGLLFRFPAGWVRLRLEVDCLTIHFIEPEPRVSYPVSLTMPVPVSAGMMIAVPLEQVGGPLKNGRGPGRAQDRSALVIGGEETAGRGRGLRGSGRGRGGAGKEDGQVRAKGSPVRHATLGPLEDRAGPGVAGIAGRARWAPGW